jgi:hypothetical protein
VYSGLRTRNERGFTRNRDKYERRPRFFILLYHRTTLDHSGWVKTPNSVLGPT